MNFYDVGFLDDLYTKLPPLFTRETASQMTGGIFSPKTLSNFDAVGKGPRRKMRIGKKVVYAKDSFIDWLRRMLEDTDEYKPNFKIRNCW